VTPARPSLIGALLTVAVAVACGANHPRAKPPPRPSGSQPDTRKGASATPIVTLPGLGSLNYRCDSNRRVEVSLDTRAATATESATVEGANGRHLRAATLNPGRIQLTAPAARYQMLTWRVIQSTEPRTLEATVRLHLDWTQDSSDCSPTNWTVTVNVIGHQSKWSVPNAWP
jgi:hypothetical protein